MLSLALTGLGLLAKLFGAVSLAEQLFAAAQQRQAGRIEQQATDLKASAKVEAKVSQAAANAPKTDDEVAEILGQGKL